MAMEYDEAAKHGYWTSQLDEAHDFMMKGLKCPVADCGEQLVSLPDAARDAGVEVVFSDRPHVGDLPRIFLLREGQMSGFVNVAREFNHRGWVMRVEDGYRTRRMQKGLGMMPFLFDRILAKVEWELGNRIPKPAFFLKRLLTLVAQIPKIAPHMSGSALDISVLDRATGLEIDRGGPYLEMSERTPMHSPFLSPKTQRNRREITAVMREGGFIEYPYEFWHYGSGDVFEECIRCTGPSVRYGAVDYDAATGKTTPLMEPWKLLNSLEELQAAIQDSLDRRSLSNSSGVKDDAEEDLGSHGR